MKSVLVETILTETQTSLLLKDLENTGFSFQTSLIKTSFQVLRHLVCSIVQNCNCSFTVITSNATDIIIHGYPIKIKSESEKNKNLTSESEKHKNLTS